MNRKIIDFFQDEHHDWVAKLDCHHNQHVRHQPPFINREWVETEQGRAAKIGMELNCVRCERFEFPEGLVFYQKTPEFTEDTIPAGLLKDHKTKTGTWGIIRVSEGSLQYRAGEHLQEVTDATPGIVVPNMLHSVSPGKRVRFCVEFYRDNKD